MRRFLANNGLEVAVACFCAWQASDLLTAWRHSPLDRLGWLAFAIWSAPVAVGMSFSPDAKSNSVAASVIALALGFTGRLLDVNGLLCVALALALSVFVQGGPRKLLWLAGGVAWMPVLGWLARDASSSAVVCLRLATSAAASAVLLLPQFRRKLA
jgi:hypothetical protein